MIAEAFRTAAASGRAALIPYVTAGHPVGTPLADVLEMLVGEGADVVEVGIPFSDPLADGPIIQRSSFEAIRGGMNAHRVLDLVADLHARSDVPIVLFTYLNPVLRYGLDGFLTDAGRAGVAGLLVTDLPAGADAGIEEALAASSLDAIRLVAPTTPPERARRIAERATGFLYYVSRTGVTGAHARLDDELEARVTLLRALSPVPVAVGFGISTPEQAGRVAAVADGVVVGSALVEALGEGGIPAGRRLVSGLRSAVDRQGWA